jgi:hypothetical protein
MKDGFLVLGMHRSGTSTVAGVLTKLGISPPTTLMPPNQHNERGYFESIRLMHLHDELLASAGTTWNDWRQFNSTWYGTAIAESFKKRAENFLREEFGDHPAFVLKDPRCCRFAPFWFEVFERCRVVPRVVIPIRSPLEVALSLRRRENFPLNMGILLWLRHVLDAEYFSRPHQRAIVHWPDLLKDWRNTMAAVAEAVGRASPRLSDHVSVEVETYLSDVLRHHEVTDSELSNHSEVHQWVLVAYNSLCKLTDQSSSNSARAALDDIRSQFERAADLFGRNLAALEARSSLLQKTLLDQESTAAECESRYVEASTQLSAVRERATQFAGDLLVKQAELDRINEELAHLTTRLSECISRSEDYRRAASDWELRHAEASAKFDAIQAKSVALTEEISAKQAEMDKLRTELAGLTASYDESVLRTNDSQRSISEWEGRHKELSDQLANLQNILEDRENTIKVLEKRIRFRRPWTRLLGVRSPKV